MRGSIIPWSARWPRPLATMEKEFSDLMERLFKQEGEWPAFGGEFMPRTNVAETEGQWEVTVELPGLKPEEFHVEMHDGELWITGEKTEEKEEKEKTWHRVERVYGQFRRVIPLPTEVNKEKILAEFHDGVLKVTIPKMEEAKPKHIEVKTASS